LSENRRKKREKYHHEKKVINEKIMNYSVSPTHRSVSPETKLLVELMLQTIKDTKNKSSYIRNQAIWWIKTEFNSALSFDQVCLYLNINASAARKAIFEQMKK